MKTLPIIFSALLSSTLLVNGQISPGTSQAAGSSAYTIAESGADYRVWQKTNYETTASGSVIPHIHRYTELATGLNYLTNGQWLPSKEEINILPTGGASATQGQHQAYFSGDINNGEIRVITSDGQVLRSRPLGLSYDDGTNSVLIAELTNSIGQLVSSNQVLYPDAFVDIKADLRFTYTKAGLEQDIVLRAAPPMPQSYGLNPTTTRLQVLTEFFSPPQPTVKSSPLPSQAGMVLTDQTLDFGAMKMIRGRAFSLGEQTNNRPTLVSKQWLLLNGRQLLVEEVPLGAIADGLAALPPTAMAPGTTNMSRVASRHLALPPQRLVKANGSKTMVLTKATLPSSGFVLDYQVINSDKTDCIFQGDTTYDVSGYVNLNGTTTLEGGTVIKFDANDGLSTYGSLVCKTAPYRPACFTSKDDNSIGESIGTGSPATQGDYLDIVTDSINNLHDLRFSYAGAAIEADNENIRNSQFVHCNEAIWVWHNISLYNVLFAQCANAMFLIYQDGTIVGNNLTTDGNLVEDSADTLCLTNCILADGVYATTINADSDVSTINLYVDGIAYVPGPLFQTAGGGNYYLANNSICRNAGDANIDPELLADLRRKTTYPPVDYTPTTISADTTFSQQVPRDVDTPDLGYHYDPLDYTIGNLSLSANLVLASGVAVGLNGAITPLDGGNISSVGQAQDMNQIVSCPNVQESGTGFLTFLLLNSGSDPSRTFQFRFTDFSVGQGRLGYVVSSGSGMPPFGDIGFSDCRINAGSLYGNIYQQNSYSSYTSIELTNNLMLRASVNFTYYTNSGYHNVFMASFCNNLWKGGALTLNNTSSTQWTIKDNLFDQSTQSLSPSYYGPSYSYSNNGFTTGTTHLPSGAGDKAGLDRDFQLGPLGDNYYPATGGATSLATLIDAGSQSAADAGLYDFTTQVGTGPTSKEGDSQVDIGYHYVAVDANSNAIDSNGDGLPDYWADMYGLGSSPVDGANGDADGDGLSNLQEYQMGSSPVENDGFANPLAVPPVGARYLRIISPTVLELVRITASGDNTWNYGGTPPPVGSFQVNGANPASVGFKRRPLYQSYTDTSDTRIENSIYLTLSSAINDNTIVQVQKAGTWNSTDWPDDVQFISHADPFRYGPAIHVNQDGYLPNQSKKAKVGYYLGSLGELALSPAPQFSIVDATTGASVYTGNLTARGDTGWNTGQEQYQHVLEADFSTFQTPGTYRLKVPGLGVSFPFNVTNSIALKWARTYALGLYGQRCGIGANGLQVNDMPYTSFVHNDCHVADAYVPKTSTSWPDPASVQFYNGRLAGYNYPACGGTTILGYKDGCQTAASLCTFESGLYGLPSAQQIPTSGGHHDAGDYSKYVASCAFLLHTLTFPVDNFSGAANLSDLGIPESGKTTPGGPTDADLLEEAKWEADFLVKMQDTDGGFFFLVYPTGQSEYETTTPDRNQGQLIFPKNTGATAAAVAALAEIGSSPAFKARYPQQASAYITAAVNGWNFLNTALANHGTGQWPYSGAYQTIIPSFGGYYMHQDSLLWAAAAMFAAGQVGGQNGVGIDPHTKFLSWLDAQSTGVSAQTWHYGYSQTTCGTASLDSYGIPADFGPLFYGFGCAFRNYVFAVQSGRLSPRTVNTSGTQVTLVSGPNFDPAWTGNVRIDGINYAISGSVTTTTMTLSSSAGTQTAIKFTKNGDTTGLNTDALKLCENEILNAGQFWRQDSAHTSYGTSFDDALKAGYNASFYFSTDPAFALAVSDALVTILAPSDPAYVSGHDYAADHTANVEAILENFNYQHGCNPLNVSFVTGLGWKRQRQIVSQYEDYPNYDVRLLPPPGIPLGNLSSEFAGFESDLNQYFYPALGQGTATFALYDRWGDAHNVNREFTSFRAANALGAAAYLHSLSGAASPAWNNSPGYFTFLSGPTTNVPTVVRLDTSDSSVNLDQAQITWDVDSGDQPAFGRAFTLKPRTTVGDTLVEAEAVLPDGRRVFGRQYVHFRPSSGGQELPNDGNTVALYHFNGDTPANKFKDDSGNGRDLIGSGFPDLVENNSWMATASPSPAYQAARFGAIGDQIASSVTIPYASLPGGSTGLTIEFELYVKRLPYLGSALTLFSFTGQPPGNSSSEWSIRYRTDLAPYPYFQAPNDHVVPDDSQAESSAIWAAKMIPNTWHAVKITATTAGLTTVYIDDMANAVASANKPVNWNVTTWQLSMGNFIGCIDELRISKGVH